MGVDLDRCVEEITEALEGNIHANLTQREERFCESIISVYEVRGSMTKNQEDEIRRIWEDKVYNAVW